jgi:hypothetical protein
MPQNIKLQILKIKKPNKIILSKTMTTAKSLGIWMDHSTANLMEYSNAPIKTKTIESEYTHEQRQEGLSKSESMMHNKEQQHHAEYYKKLGEIIKHYDSVVLFGPTDAKLELHNILKSDHHFDAINIEVLQADKMTENQQHAFVRSHFLKPKASH